MSLLFIFEVANVRNFGRKEFIQNNNTIPEVLVECLHEPRSFKKFLMFGQNLRFGLYRFINRFCIPAWKQRNRTVR